MSISHRIQDLVAKRDFDTIEGDWLARMEENPNHLDYFTAVARTLVGQGEDARARFLLEMLDDHLKGEGRFKDRLDLLKRSGDLLRASAEAQHRDILETLEHLYGHHASFAGLLETVGLTRAKNDIPKTWDKVGRLESLITFDLGTVVWMEGKGSGRVREVNLELQSFRIDFERFPRLAVGFRAAPKVLTPLAPDHVLYRKLDEPEVLSKLAEEDPSEMLRVILTSYDEPLGAGKIKADISGLIPETRWTGWWAAARKHPQVVTHGKGKQTYSWATSSEHAQEKVWQAFEKAPPRRQIQLLRREGERDLDLRQRMEEVLARKAEAIFASEPGLAAEIWFALERSGSAPAEVSWSPRALLARGVDPRQVLGGIEDRALRERTYGILREEREDWADHFMTALGREEDPRTLDLLTETLAAVGHPELPRFYDGTLSQPHKVPAAFTWLVERAGHDEALRARSPLRLLQQAVAGPSTPELAAYRLRLLAQVESGGTVVKLLSHLTEDQAPQAEDALHRAAGLEGYQRDDLIKALHLRFPSLRGEDAHEIVLLHALSASIEAKRNELNQILKQEIPVNRKAIEEARALGDLRENFEYKSARQRHEYLTARAIELKDQLARARPVDLAHLDASQVRVGTRVRLTGDDGQERLLTILGPWESDPDAGVISYESELGSALLGHGPGATIEVGGNRYTVAEITLYEG